MKKDRSNVSELQGKQEMFETNIAPRKTTREISEGVICDIGFADEILPTLAISERRVPDRVRAG